MTREPDPDAGPRVLLIGDDRTRARHDNDDWSLSELAERLPETRAVVVKPGPLARSARIRWVRPWAFRPLTLLALVRVIREEARDADIIDIHNARSARLALLFGAFRRKAMAVHFDGSTGGGVDRSTAPRIKGLRHLVDLPDRRVYRRASLAIAANGNARRELVERYGVSPWRIRTHSRSGFPGRFDAGDRDLARERLMLPAGAFVACYVNAPVPPTEAQLLFDAWGELVGSREADVERRPVRLLLASAGEARGALRATAVPEGLSESVSVIGRVDGDALAELLRASDVNVAASSCERAGAIALAAASCGTPSIVREPDLVDRLAELDPSLVVPHDDAGALARRLAAAAHGALPDRRNTGAWATQRQWDRRVALHRELYEELAARRPPGPPKVKVVYLGHVAQLSGGEIALVRLLEALEGVDAHVILAEDGALVERLYASGVSVEVLPLRERTRGLHRDRARPTRIPAAALLDTALYMLRLARRLRSIRPDLVHTNTLKAGVYGSLAARLAGVPVVWHVRDRIASDYLRRSTTVVLRALIATLPDSVIVNSAATGETLWRSRRHVASIHSPIADPVNWRAVPRRTTEDRFVVGMIGRIAPWKGQHVLLEAFAKAFGEGSEVAIIVGAAMFGAAETAYETQLHERANALGLSHRVIFRGFRADVWRELVEMDVFVHASITPEPFGQVVVEAMLAGTPVIAAAAGGPTETVTHGVDGLLCPPGDVDALAISLRRLRDDPDLRNQLAATARRRAAAFSPEDAASAVTAVYRRILFSPEP